MPKTTARRRALALAAAAAAAFALAAPAASAAAGAPRAPRADGWAAAVWGGLERIFAAQGGCIDPDGVRCLVQPTSGARTGLCLDASSRPVDCRLAAAGAWRRSAAPRRR